MGNGVERGAGYLMQRAPSIGPNCSSWAQALMASRGIPAIRVLQGFLGLTKRLSSKELEQACGVALTHDVFRLKALKTLLKEKAEPQVKFLGRHPVIREMTEYDEYVLAASEAIDAASKNNEPRRRSTHE